MKKKQVIEQLQSTLEETISGWIDTKKDLEETKKQKDRWFDNWNTLLKTSSELEISLNEYKNMSVFQFIKSKYARIPKTKKSKAMKHNS